MIDKSRWKDGWTVVVVVRCRLKIENVYRYLLFLWLANKEGWPIFSIGREGIAIGGGRIVV